MTQEPKLATGNEYWAPALATGAAVLYQRTRIVARDSQYKDLPKIPYPVTIRLALHRALSTTPIHNRSPAGLAGEKGNEP